MIECPVRTVSLKAGRETGLGRSGMRRKIKTPVRHAPCGADSVHAVFMILFRKVWQHVEEQPKSRP